MAKDRIYLGSLLKVRYERKGIGLAVLGGPTGLKWMYWIYLVLR